MTTLSLHTLRDLLFCMAWGASMACAKLAPGLRQTRQACARAAPRPHGCAKAALGLRQVWCSLGSAPGCAMRGAGLAQLAKPWGSPGAAIWRSPGRSPWRSPWRSLGAAWAQAWRSLAAALAESWRSLGAALGAVPGAGSSAPACDAYECPPCMNSHNVIFKDFLPTSRQLKVARRKNAGTRFSSRTSYVANDRGAAYAAIGTLKT